MSGDGTAGAAGGGFDVAKFVESFPVIAEAEGGLKRLRWLVLELAVRGQFTSSSPDDCSVCELLDRAEVEWRARLQAGTARTMSDLASVSESEEPFPLPNSWTWTRIGRAMNLVNGRAFKPSDWSATGMPIIRIQNLNSPSAPFNYCAGIVEPRHRVSPGNLLISWSGTPGTSFGAFIWNGPPGVLNQHIFRVEAYGDAYELRFLEIAVNARLDEMIAHAHGAVGLQHITKGKLEALPIPLPPIAEQKRIVAKVDELMRLIDDLEAKRKRRGEAQARWRTAALAELMNTQEPTALSAAWDILSKSSGVIFHSSENIATLRQVLVDLAADGRLIGSPGSAQGRPKTCLSRVLKEPLANGRSVPDGPNGFPVLRLSALRGQFVNIEDHKLGAWTAAEAQRFLVREGDVLFVRGNGAIRLVGRACIAGRPKFDVAYPDTAIRARPDLDIIDPKWLWLVWESTDCRVQIARTARTTAGIFKVSQENLSEVTFLLPPLAEQKRIVAKVDQLMALCDALEAALRRKEQAATKLAEAVVAEMVA